MRGIFPVLILLGLCGPVMACINDNESPTHEREFRTQYFLVAKPPEGAQSLPVDLRLLMVGGGALLMAAGLIVTYGSEMKAKPCCDEFKDFS